MPWIDNPIIGFSEEDAWRLHNGLVVSIQVGDYNTYQVLVDNRSSTDILYYLAFQQMRIDRDHLIPTNAPLVGFGGIKAYPFGAITLPITIGDYPQQITKDVTFLVVNCSSAYNFIIGRPTLNSWKAITLTYHLMVKFPTEYGVCSRGIARRSGSCARMLYRDARDGWPFTNHKHRGTVDGGGTHREALRNTPL